MSDNSQIKGFMSKKILMAIFNTKKTTRLCYHKNIFETRLKYSIILINGEKLLLRYFLIKKIYRLIAKVSEIIFLNLRVKYEHK